MGFAVHIFLARTAKTSNGRMTARSIQRPDFAPESKRIEGESPELATRLFIPDRRLACHRQNNYFGTDSYLTCEALRIHAGRAVIPVARDNPFGRHLFDDFSSLADGECPLAVYGQNG